MTRTFATTVALAMISAYASAVCTNPDDCTNYPEVETAVADLSGGLEWQFYDVDNADGYNLKMFRFEGPDSALDFRAKSAVLLLHGGLTNCLAWLTNSVDTGSSSVPQQLFEAGHDVWIGCKRGTAYSRTNNTLNADTPAEEATQFWNFGTTDIGEDDITTFVNKIRAENLGSGNGADCKKVQIVAHSLGAAEALVTLSSYPASSSQQISQVVALAPCAVPTVAADDRRRLASEAPRELDETIEEERQGRSLKPDRARSLKHAKSPKSPKSPKSAKSPKAPKEPKAPKSPSPPKAPKEPKAPKTHSPSSSPSPSPSPSPSSSKSKSKSQYKGYWGRVEKYCDHYPDTCFDFCDWYPHKCEQFCERFPNYCVPKKISDYYALLQVLADLEIYSLYGDATAWQTKVDAICADVRVSEEKCSELTTSVALGFGEMSVKQLEQLWQQGYTGQFDSYSATFATDGWLVDTPEYPVADITVPVNAIYIDEDPICSDTVNQAVLSMNAAQTFETTLSLDSVTHTSIIGANNEPIVTASLLLALSLGEDQDVTPCEAVFVW